MVYHRDPHRATQKRPRYAIVDGRPFLPFRLLDKQPTEPNRPPYRSDNINALKDFEFTPQTLAPGSLNPENAAAPRDASSRDLLKNLRFVNAKDQDVGPPRLALVLGRLTAQHFNPERASQSYWIVFLDQTRMLWACYACGIDNEDITLDKTGNPGPYHASCDTAFGAKKDQGQRVVFLGALKDIPFKEKEELNAEAHDLDWSTSALPEDMILEMKNQDLPLATRKKEGNDGDTTDDAKMKDSGSKKEKNKQSWNAKKDAKKRKDGIEKDRENKDMGVEENDEEKLYGTKEPTDPKDIAEKKNLKKEDNGEQESPDTEDSLAKDVDMEDPPLRSAETDVLPDADSTPGHGPVED